MFDIGWGALAVVWLAVLAGAFVQGSIGFGFALTVTPVLSLIEPAAVPAALLIVAAPLNVGIAAREWRAVDRPSALHVTIGMIVGTAAAVPVLRAVPEDLLTVAIGSAIVVAVAIAALNPHARFGARGTVIAGAGSGLINTIAGTGGPLIALLHQSRPGPVMRSTLAVAFLAAVVLSVVGLGVAGRLGVEHLVLALELLLPLLVGLWLSRHGARVADRGWLRPAVLVFAAGAGLATLISGLA